VISAPDSDSEGPGDFYSYWTEPASAGSAAAEAAFENLAARGAAVLMSSMPNTEGGMIYQNMLCMIPDGQANESSGETEDGNEGSSGETENGNEGGSEDGNNDNNSSAPAMSAVGLGTAVFMAAMVAGLA
jgi:hypothetical protein